MTNRTYWDRDHNMIYENVRELQTTENLTGTERVGNGKG